MAALTFQNILIQVSKIIFELRLYLTLANIAYV